MKDNNNLEPWNIKQLQQASINALSTCNTAFERSMAIAIGGKEIREKASEFARVRTLTPVEIAIASQYGYRG